MGLDLDPWEEVIFTENTAPDREIWDEKGGLIKKGAAEIAERDQEMWPPLWWGEEYKLSLFDAVWHGLLNAFTFNVIILLMVLVFSSLYIYIYVWLWYVYCM